MMAVEKGWRDIVSNVKDKVDPSRVDYRNQLAQREQEDAAHREKEMAEWQAWQQEGGYEEGRDLTPFNVYQQMQSSERMRQDFNNQFPNSVDNSAALEQIGKSDWFDVVKYGYNQSGFETGHYLPRKLKPPKQQPKKEPEKTAHERHEESERAKAQEAANAASLERTAESRAKTSEGIANLTARMAPPKVEEPVEQPTGAEIDERLSTLTSERQKVKDAKAAAQAQAEAEKAAEAKRVEDAKAAEETAQQAQDDAFQHFQIDKPKEAEAQAAASAEAAQGREDARGQWWGDVKQKVGDTLQSRKDRGIRGNIKDALVGGTRAVMNAPEHIGQALDVATSPVASAKKVGEIAEDASGGALSHYAKPVVDVATAPVRAGADLAGAALQSGKEAVQGWAQEEKDPQEGGMGVHERIQNEKGNYGGMSPTVMGRKFNPDSGKWEKPDPKNYQLTEADKATNAKISELKEKLANPGDATQGQIEAWKAELDKTYSSGIGGGGASNMSRSPQASTSSQWWSKLMYGDRPLTAQTKEKLRTARKERTMAKGVDPEQKDDYYAVNKQPPPPPPPPPPPMDGMGMPPPPMGMPMGAPPMMGGQPPPPGGMGPPDPETGEPRKRGKEFTVDPETEADEEKETNVEKWFQTLKQK